jgi:hypothetical protein
VRIVKSVEIPNKTVRKLNNSAFGPAGMGMREILGYAPIQPDGSVQIQVPANVPFIDRHARRQRPARHGAAYELDAGDPRRDQDLQRLPYAAERQCDHVRPSHGRFGLTDSINPGAPTQGTNFPGTNPAILAQARRMTWPRRSQPIPAARPIRARRQRPVRRC